MNSRIVVIVVVLVGVVFLAAGTERVGATDLGAIESRPIWRALLLVYTHTSVEFADENGDIQSLVTTMPEWERARAVDSFRQAASLVHDYSDGHAILLYDVVYIERPLDSLTSLGAAGYWASPEDTRNEIDHFAPPGAYDSILVHWMQCDTETGRCVPSYGWGWGMGPSSWSNDATYATVSSAPEYAWDTPVIGEPWLHEWLHGVCYYYAGRGYPMPLGDADGAESHGYERSVDTGWSEYYRDLMTGNVWEPTINNYAGITSAAWKSAGPRRETKNVAVDYFFSNTLGEYERAGTISWDPTNQRVLLGDSISMKDNGLYMGLSDTKHLILSGRVLIPEEFSYFDSTALAVRGGAHEYWATLAYGKNLVQKDHISIMLDDEWGELYEMVLLPGWYTIKVKVDYQENTIWMKAWADNDNEPGWQTSRVMLPNWLPEQVGFRHYGVGGVVDDLIVVTESEQYITYVPSIMRH